MAPSPSGKARVCKTLIPSSNLGGASNFITSTYVMVIKYKLSFREMNVEV